MSLYQVGDVVRVKDGFTECDAIFVEDMRDFFGKEVTISHVSPDIEDRYHIEDDMMEWWWSDDCFDGLAVPEDEHPVSLEGLL